jgi:hypothetical protein
MASLHFEIHRRQSGIVAELYWRVYDVIAKRIDMRDASKSRATRLAKYVTDELERAGRVADVFTANCISDDALLAAKEIEICQAMNTRTKDDKTYHLLLSFPDGERPDKDQMRAMADAAVKALGYGEHQRIAAVHDDTDNLHMHLIINKIHPERFTIHTPRRDFKILAEVCVKLERESSLARTNHETKKSAAEAKAMDMEAHSGAESFLSYTRKKAIPILAAARSWDELHRALTEAGIALQLKGNGLVVTDHTGIIAVKASSVARDFSKAKLEKRFGAFIMSETARPPDKSSDQKMERLKNIYKKEPPSHADRLYDQYQFEKENTWKERKTQLAAVWDKQKIRMRQIAASAKLNLPRTASYHLKKRLRLEARNAASARNAELRRAMAKECVDIKARHTALGYIEWLKRQAEGGNVSAIYALRKRGAVAPALVNITASDFRDAKIIAAKIAHVTGRGTLFYKVGEDVFRDNGSHLSLKKEIGDQGVKAALLIAMAKFNGQSLAVNGSDVLKAKCVEVAVREGLRLIFADPDMERERQRRITRLDKNWRLVVPQTIQKNENNNSDKPPKRRGPER